MSAYCMVIFFLVKKWSDVNEIIIIVFVIIDGICVKVLNTIEHEICFTILNVKKALK